MQEKVAELEGGGNSRFVRFLMLETSIPATVMTGLHPEEMVVWVSIKVYRGPVQFTSEPMVGPMPRGRAMVRDEGSVKPHSLRLVMFQEADTILLASSSIESSQRRWLESVVTESLCSAPSEAPKWEVHVSQLERSPCLLQLEKSLHSHEHPAQPKINKNFLKVTEVVFERSSENNYSK